MFFDFKIIRYIKKLIKWVPFLWKDEDWDYYYLLRIIKFKLEDMKIVFEKDNILKESSKKAKEINIIINHLEHYLDIEKYTSFSSLSISFTKELFPHPLGPDKTKSPPVITLYPQKILLFSYLLELIL